VRVFQLLLHHSAVRALADAAAAEGVEAHLVGGILRDRFLGLPSRDVDAMVSDRGEAVANRLGKALSARVIHLGGKQFGAYRLVVRPQDRGEAHEYTLDLWDREGTSVEADLARRDFTINAIALSAPRGEILDPFDGFPDLRRRVLRATTPSSLAGDPLRVLRLVRLSVQLPGFTADPATLELAREAAPAVAEVASERVREELSLLFSKPEPHRALSLLETLDLYPGLWLGRPGEAVRGPHGERASAGSACRELGELAPRALHLRQLAGGTLPLPVRHRLARLAVTFAHLPALARDADTMTALERLSSAGYLTRKDAADVRTLLPWDRLPAEEPERRRFLHATGELWTTAACFAAVRHEKGWAERAVEVIRLERAEGEAIRQPPPLVDGQEIGRLLGVDPGPEIGRAVAALRRAQVDGRVRTREQAVALVRSLASGSLG